MNIKGTRKTTTKPKNKDNNGVDLEDNHENEHKTTTKEIIKKTPFFYM